ncbi:glycosyltransferase family 32 protein [Lutimaribacter saemankumensis]|uniref:Glycosyltransferase sugar-binding region containing DXD motif-containing protein n=1 Tax=Lutimaribacter saemankumensis TaxID=490829 RepID=A0A1G8R032_9RHOB|nr:glycosyltransferase [Lutimaribacter saemankumensis]SDJ10291.1 Glycosyltransferase sugar-binding region containing DXD motif-containing protein [Lutimaribacter saemankumensis]
MQIDKFVPSRHLASNRRIPEIIHQTFSSTRLENKMRNAVKSWLDLNPSYSYHFYDDADQTEFVRTHFGKRVHAAYNRLSEGAFRADLWRYCVLYQLGGVYADIDTVCLTPLNDFVDDDIAFFVPSEKGTGGPPHTVFNALVGSIQGHPFLARAIEYATELIHRSHPYDGFMMVGPGALGAGINSALGRSLKSPHQVGKQSFGDSTYEILEKTPAQNGLPPLIVDGTRVLVQSRYEGYFEDLKSGGHAHWLSSRPSIGLKQRIRNRLAKENVYKKLKKNGLSPLQYP